MPKSALPMLLLLACSTDRVTPGAIRISEVVSANAADSNSGGCDELGECQDWIEVENLTDRRLDLRDLWISDSDTNPLRHRLRHRDPIAIEPRGYQILFADGQPD